MIIRGGTVVDGTGENAIVVAPGANAALTDLTELDLAAIGAADVLLCQLEIPLATVTVAVLAARKAGTKVVRLLKLVRAFCSMVSGCRQAPRRCVCFFQSASVANSAAKCGSQKAMWHTRPMPNTVISLAPCFFRSAI